MKNRLSLFTVLAALLLLVSCAGSRGYGSQRKGYGCPTNAYVPAPSATAAAI
jgi:hypothetical protein